MDKIMEKNVDLNYLQIIKPCLMENNIYLKLYMIQGSR